MARIRTIKPEFPQSESMGRVSRESRLCFIMLWTIADDQGRLRGNSRMLASLLYPYDDDAKKHIDGWLDQLSSEGCVSRYEVDGTSYIQICNWTDHQKIDKPSASKLPAPKEEFENIREDSRGFVGGRDLGKEGKGRGESDESRDDSSPTPTPSGILLPLNDGTEFDVSLETIAEWRSAYPAVDVEQQLREMRVWCLNNPVNRKTRRGIGAFVTRWLGREQDKAPRVLNGSSSSNPIFAGAI